MLVEDCGKLKAKGGREAALKKSREDAEGEGVELEPYDFQDDPGSNNSGYYELQVTNYPHLSRYILNQALLP